MSLQAILASIEADARAEAERARATAATEADRIRHEAEAAAARRVEAALAAAEPALRAEAARVVNAARLRLLRRRAELAAGRTEAAWTAAEREIDAIVRDDGPRWRRARQALATEALQLAGPGAREVAAPDAPGVIVRSADERLEIDATLPTRLRRARHLLTGTAGG